MQTLLALIAICAVALIAAALAFIAGRRIERRVVDRAAREVAPDEGAALPLRHQHAELAALHDTTLGLINHLDVDDLLELLVGRASALLDTEHGYLYVVDAAEDRLVVRVGTGVFGAYIGYGLRRGEGLAGRAWASGTALAIENYAGWDERRQDLDELRLRALASVPIRAGEEFVGVLGLAYVDPSRTFGPAEIALLERFADMASLVLENARLYSAAQQELAERRRTEQALRAAETELRQAKELAETDMRAKSEFLEHMSHEIRTPITSVVGMTTLLADTGLTDHQRELVAVIRTGGEALKALIDNFLDLAKIEVGPPDLVSEAFEPATCVEEAIDLVAVSVAGKGLDLAYTLDPGIPALLLGDWPRLRQIVVNLLSNAIKFTDAGGVLLSIDARPLAHGEYELHYAVADTGIGIAPEHLDEVFVPFRQIRSARARSSGGTGLGLAICRRLSQLMGGRIWVESMPGAGSTFHFTAVVRAGPAIELPAEPAPPPGTRLLFIGDHPQSRDAIAGFAASAGMPLSATGSAREALAWIAAGAVFDAAILDARADPAQGAALAAELRGAHAAPLPVVVLAPFAQHDTPAPSIARSAIVRVPLKLSQLRRALAELAAPTEHRDAQPAPAALRILIVEDDNANRRLGLWLVEKLGHQADAAATAADALAALERARYDIVLLDLQLPDMDGLDVAPAIRRRPDAPYLIAVSAADAGARRARRDAEIDDCLGKPLQLDELRGAIERSAGKRKAQAAAPAHTSAPTTDTTVDPAVLAKIRALLHGKQAAGLRDLVTLYRDDAIASLDQMRRAADGHQADTLRRAAHKLRASSALLGAPRLAQLCGQLEHAAETLPPTTWPPLVDQIAAELDSVQAALAEER
jgi:signal transduction histidine kinase/CheY-like chemotaxis protein